MMLHVLFALLACSSRAPQLTTTLVETGLDRLELAGAEGPFAPDPAQPALLPVGRWIDVAGTAVWPYVDPEKGLSVQWRDAGPEGRTHIRRLRWAPAVFRPIDEDERVARGLPETPEWLASYGPQAPPGTLHGTWRADPALRHRFHPEFPDDLRVVIAGTAGRYEVVWVRVRTCDALRCDVALLNQPDHAPGLTVGSPLVVDWTGIARDRLAVAAPPGERPDATLSRYAAESPELAGLLQDDTAWEVDLNRPPEERLVPLGAWGWVGSEATFFFLGPRGPVALLASATGVRFQSVTWLPSGWRPMTEEERVRLGLPASPAIEGAVPHEPGPWGTWRVDPATSWLFRNPEEPDGIFVLLLAEAEGPLTGSEPHGTLLVTGCDGLRCQGTLAADAGNFRAGQAFEVFVVRTPEVEDHWVPVARPAARPR